MKKSLIGGLLITISMFLFFGCEKNSSNKDSNVPADSAGGDPSLLPEVPIEALPDGLEWLTNESDPAFADPNAKSGGTYRASITSYPLTFRLVGPDSNGSFAYYTRATQFGLIGIHPNTRNIIPGIATHWAYGKDKKSMFFKINPNAKWSDGKPITADDFTFVIDFMRSKYIVAPFYNDYYTKEIEKIVKYGTHTIGIFGTKPKPDLHLVLNENPIPRHFYGKIDKDFVRKFNWEPRPASGPYFIDSYKKGKSITFKRIKDWWGNDLKYFKNRFNVDKVLVKVIRDMNVEFEHFRKGDIDTFGLTLPQFWHEKAVGKEFDLGAIKKLWFYNDKPRSAMGMWLNSDKEIFKDVNVRHAYAHAMNVEKVIKAVLRGDYERLDNHWTGYGKYTNSKIKARKYDISKVKELMTKSGWKRGSDGIWEKNGKRFSVEVVYGYDVHTKRLVVLKEEAKKAGVEMVLKLQDSSSSFKTVLEKKHDVAWMGWGTGLRPEPWQHYHSENAHKVQTNNISNMDDKKMDELIDKFRDSIDEDERVKLSHQIQDRLHELGHYVPTFEVPYFRSGYWAWWRLPSPPATKLSDSAFDMLNQGTGGLAWFDSELKEKVEKHLKEGKKIGESVIVDKTYRAK